LSEGDGPCDWDLSFPDAAAAEDYCAEVYGLTDADWHVISDPLPGCQDDWVAPVRVKGRLEGKPEWGRLEELGPDGLWRDIGEPENGAG
jgi:hypothetical protein